MDGETKGLTTQEIAFKFLDSLTDALGDSKGQTPDEIREELRSEGYDIDAAERRLSRFLAWIQAKTKDAPKPKATIGELESIMDGEQAVSIEILPSGELVQTMHHVDNENCWCEPELDYEDPDTGNQVWVHRRLQ